MSEVPRGGRNQTRLDIASRHGHDATSNRKAGATEPSSWRPVIAMILTAVGVYAVLAIVLVPEATVADVHGLVWLAVPGLLFFAATVSVFASFKGVRRRLAAFKVWFVEAGPGERTAPSVGTSVGDA